ncbi:hypothetical protein IWZ03DRAFT_376777 [Phyllosticta citriasiana]|uniref:Secreted protein n=1 Tax=Phyllosticta citriasiana TaxID=595635 RepID=A0ABR1KPM0_9PEZI
MAPNGAMVTRVTRLSTFLACCCSCCCFCWLLFTPALVVFWVGSFTTVCFPFAYPPPVLDSYWIYHPRPGSSPVLLQLMFFCSWFPFLISSCERWMGTEQSRIYTSDGYNTTPKEREVERERCMGGWGVLSCPAYDDCLPACHRSRC